MQINDATKIRIDINYEMLWKKKKVTQHNVTVLFFKTLSYSLA